LEETPFPLTDDSSLIDPPVIGNAPPLIRRREKRIRTVVMTVERDLVGKKKN
jgi:hypothetical protein